MHSLRFVSSAAAAVVIATAPAIASAHGLHGHVHVTGWAISNLPPGELRDVFEDPDVREAALAGAMFPDTGYALGSDAARAYGEHAHWEPFIEDFVQRVRTTYGPTYDTKEERMLVAFLMGCAAHGLQDELFDSTFLYEAEQRDGHGQDATDPGTDGFLVQDGYFWMTPSEYLPIADLLPLYASLPQSAEIDEDLIRSQVRRVRGAYVNDTIGPTIAEGNGERYRPQIPWTAEHYMDPAVAGSLYAEITPTARYMLALWERLHDRFEESELVIHAWPDAPRRLREADHTSVASWVTLVLGKGVQQDGASATLVDSLGAPHGLELRYTRWGGVSRLVRVVASADYTPGETYTATLASGAMLVDGSSTTSAHEHTFQVACATEDDPRCPPLGEIEDPVIPPAPEMPDAGPPPRIDAGVAPMPEPSPSSSCAVSAAATRARAEWLALVVIALVAVRVSRRSR
ncbi:zinc dependent phospholipase C family protein [Sandaracinus amylolyticus]|uniref:Phospholipase C/D domain-containing protein n=1 Tax=Sandaracinus amylolyticus TaxID=927083 RepID=A0A0F6W9Z7_9BACT|nr:zinc dependent phospholipase C family protein [Sandaracinus amylolyticus]AKF11133.1 hypothetical protein DB32_008282 [Sandaracinus amylolyticus]